MTTNDLKNRDMTKLERTKAYVVDTIIATYLKRAGYNTDKLGTPKMHTIARNNVSGPDYAFYDEDNPSENLMFRPFYYHVVSVIGEIMHLNPLQIDFTEDPDVDTLCKTIKFQNREARIMFQTSSGSSDMPNGIVMLYCEPDEQDKMYMERMGFTGYNNRLFIMSL